MSAWAGVLLSACTSTVPTDGPSPRATGEPPSDLPIEIGVVVSVAGTPANESDAELLDGMRLAEREVNDSGGILGRTLALTVPGDQGDAGEAVAALDAMLAPGGPVAVLFVGPGDMLTGLRRRIEEARTPVFLLQGDLYTTRGLFKQVFQTGVPVRWQARELARYLVADRRYDRVAVAAEEGPQAAGWLDAFRAEMAEEGAAPAMEVTHAAGRPVRRTALRLVEAQAVAVLGGGVAEALLADAVGNLDRDVRLAVSSQSLLPSFAGVGHLSPGTVSTYHYAWSGWAEPIPRVAEFSRRFQASFGRPPEGLQQEGYDAVRLLADSLERTGGRGGDRLVRALEQVRHATYSSLPIRLGPDDHTLIDESWLGLYAVTGRDAWEPLMRTFTTDGRRASILDRDKRVFFPSWRRNRPSPSFRRSRYGIVTGARDPLH